MTNATDEIPDYQALMLPVLKALQHGEKPVRAMIDEIGVSLGLSDDARTRMQQSGTQRIFDNRIHWARIHLAKAGLIETPRKGVLKITGDGIAVLANNPDRIDLQSLKKLNNNQISTLKSDAQTPADLMHDAHAEIEAALADDLLQRIRTASADFFERTVVRLLLAMGYGGTVSDAGRAIGKSGDDGVDGVIDQDALGLDQVYVQAKRYAAGNNVGSDAIRNFSGSLDLKRASKGLFITTSDFTANAKDTAERLHKRIVLIDGETLARLMIRHNVGCQIEDTLYVRRIDEDFFEN